MKYILSTCALFLILPSKLTSENTFKENESTTQHDKPLISSTKNTELPFKPNGETTSPSSTSLQKDTSKTHEAAISFPENTESLLKPNGETTYSLKSTRLHKDTSAVHESTIMGDYSTISSSKNTEFPLKPNGETTHSLNSTRMNDTSTVHESTIRGDKSTISSTKNTEVPLKPTHSLKSTGLHKNTATVHEATIKGDESTLSSTKNQYKYTTEESKNVTSSKWSPQSTDDQHVTSMSHAKYINNTLTISTGERRSSADLSSLPLLTETKFMPLPQKMTELVTTKRGDHQTLHNFKSTSKGLRHTQGYNTTRSEEKESFKPQTDNSNNFQNKSVVITTQSGKEVQTPEAMISTLSLRQQEKENTYPVLNTTESNGRLDITKKERNETATYLLNTPTTTGISTGLSSIFNTEVNTNGSTNSMDMKTTLEITTKDMITEPPNPNSKTTPNSEKGNPKTTTLKFKDNSNMHAGYIAASLISSVLFLMFVAVALILVRNNQKKKKQKENPDWAGPSPFIENDIVPNLPTTNEEGPLHTQESKRISLYSFFPQRLSKQLTLWSPAHEEVHLEDTQSGSTFGQCNVNSQIGDSSPDQIQTHEANSPDDEGSSDANAPKTLSTPLVPENNEKSQTISTIDEITPFTPAETNNATPTPCEDVDLNLSLDKNTRSTSTDAIHILAPPLPAPS